VSEPTRLAVPIISASPPLEQQVEAARAAGADLVELRVDCIGDVGAVERLLANPPAMPLILTVRSSEEGGGWDGDEADRVALIERLGLLVPGFVDIEYATWQRSANVRQKIGLVCAVRSTAAAGGAGRRKNSLIVSHHDLRGTPGDVRVVLDELAATPADVIKAVFTAGDATDALRVLHELGPCGHANVIALAMGPAGVASRVLARKHGAFLTFASLEAGSESAPGQPTISELRSVYRWDAIRRETGVYGVVGWPVAHSQSPAIHNAAMAASGVDGVYVPLPVKPAGDDFAAFMDLVEREEVLDVRGLSVTVPHKEHALRWLEARGHIVKSAARRCGAVNTLTQCVDGKWEGDNTDGLGAMGALKRSARFAGGEVAVLGAGGAARAIAAALIDEGCGVTLYNRSAGRAKDLAQELRCAWRPWDERVGYAGEVLVNCTLVGLWPSVDASPMPAEALRSGTLVFDTVYRPVETQLLRDARARGCTCVTGVEMFIGQATAQFERWHAVRSPVAVMRGAMSVDS